jgi:hypothetical protein
MTFPDMQPQHDTLSKPSIPMESLFEQVWVINLKRRPERLQRFWSEMKKAKWPFRCARVFEAIDGDKVGVPKFWQTGGGSYGCLRSHLNILERAIMDDVESLLVLEDDAVFMDTFDRDVADFLAKVPDDWQCLMLGGQHVNSTPIPVDVGIVRAGGGGGIQRTHCYALRGREIMKALYDVWANAAVHCDWVMGPCTAKFNTYAPEPFLVGQADGRSDISGAVNPAKFWRPPTGHEPVVVLHAPRAVMEALQEKGFHGGYDRDPESGIDVGLRDLFAEQNLSESKRDKRLKDWISMIQWEVASMPEQGICTIWHPSVIAEAVRPLVLGKVVEITASTLENALAQVPADIHSPLTETIETVLLRASRDVMEALRDRGWHSGYWRDPVTGQDNGIRELFASTTDRKARSAGLRKIVHALHDEAHRITDGVVMLWHDEITADMIGTEEIRVLEIQASSPEEAIAKWKDWRNGEQE